MQADAVEEDAFNTAQQDVVRDAEPRDMYTMPSAGDLAPSADDGNDAAPLKPEPGPMPMAPEPEPGDRVRVEALHLEGDPISQLSTSRLMAYVAQAGAQAKGIEWINDRRCAIVFDSYSGALEGMLKLQYSDADVVPVDAASFPSVDEHTEEASASLADALLQPRLALAFPRALYTSVERQTESELPDAQAKLDDARKRLLHDENGEPVPEIYRDMELDDVERRAFTKDQRRLKQLRQSLWLRFALRSHDTKPPRSAQRSNWYREHGRNAGKEVVGRLLHIGERVGPRDARDDVLKPRTRRYDDRAPRDSRMHAWADEDYAPPPSLLDRIGRARNEHDERDERDWDDDPYARPRRDRSASPDAVQIRGRGAARAPRTRGWDDT